jgi:hypothetical protein
MRRENTLCDHNVGFTNGKARRAKSRHSAFQVNPWVISVQSCNVARLSADEVFNIFFVIVLISQKDFLFPGSNMQHTLGETTVE